VGHRRLAVARELGITPRIHVVEFGDGTRLTRSGFASRSRRNLGGEPLPPEDRKDVAEYLYKERQWPMEDLAKSLASATPESVRALRTATFPHGKCGRSEGQSGAQGKPWAPEGTVALVERGAAGSG